MNKRQLSTDKETGKLQKLQRVGQMQISPRGPEIYLHFTMIVNKRQLSADKRDSDFGVVLKRAARGKLAFLKIKMRFALAKEKRLWRKAAI